MISHLRLNVAEARRGRIIPSLGNKETIRVRRKERRKGVPPVKDIRSRLQSQRPHRRDACAPLEAQSPVISERWYDFRGRLGKGSLCIREPALHDRNRPPVSPTCGSRVSALDSGSLPRTAGPMPSPAHTSSGIYRFQPENPSDGDPILHPGFTRQRRMPAGSGRGKKWPVVIHTSVHPDDPWSAVEDILEVARARPGVRPTHGISQHFEFFRKIRRVNGAVAGWSVERCASSDTLPSPLCLHIAPG